MGHKGNTNALVHGARSAGMRKRYGDLRTKEGKALKGILDNIKADFGGESEITGSQQVILDSIRTKLIVLIQVSKFIEGRESLVDENGNLLPV